MNTDNVGYTSRKKHTESLRTLESQLLMPDTPILGREKEVRELIELVKEHQVVTISGTGGIGKTRISLEIGQRVSDEFHDGVVFVSMATLTEAREIMPTLGGALGITEAAGRDLADGVANLLSDKKVPLVLDNLEHIISAANEISALVLKCASLRILCTSRTPLKIKAEHEYSLTPLGIPAKMEWETLLDYPAIELFVSRAQQVNKHFELSPQNAQEVLEICRRMDGLPLAIELAAARLRILSPTQLVQHLSNALDLLTTGPKDAPVRHQALRATIDWSYALLNAEERQLFRRLSVFSKGFTLEAIEVVCYEHEQNPITVINEIESLIDKSLVEKIDHEGRFTLLQTIRDFALEQLISTAEDDLIFQRHALYFSRLSQLIGEGTRGKQQIERMKQGSTEEANMSTALDFLVTKARKGDHAARELGLYICGELWMYWHIRGKHKSAQMYIDSFLENTNDEHPSIATCDALFCLHVSTFTLGEINECREAAVRLLNMAEVLNNELGIAKGLLALGFSHVYSDSQLANTYSRLVLF